MSSSVGPKAALRTPSAPGSAPPCPGSINNLFPDNGSEGTGVVSAVSFKIDDATYYGFYSRSYGFQQMDVYFVIDANGAIAKMDAKQFIFEKEYFMGFAGMDDAAYKAGFEGLTTETWNGDAAVIATATMTSNAVKQSTDDAFATFNAIKGGAQ